MPSTVYVVHCIDTEGPLYESMEATFQRLHNVFHLDLEPSAALLKKLQAGQVNLNGLEAVVQRVLDPRLLSYNDTWDKVDCMLEDVLSKPFRNRVLDSDGNGWIYNWFCVDHVDYDSNPRRRDMGYHNIYDHYRSILREKASEQDGLHFHFHPHPFSREAHRCATHWWAESSSLHQTLSRRIIERHWFPAAHRAGFHVTRPDSHWFLEQFIPFDFSSQAIVSDSADQGQFGVNEGRFGDWRRAPSNWQPFHPAHDDYQSPGTCRRWIARCLNVGSRYRLLGALDVRQAFEEARQGKPVVLAVTNHDFRDIRPDVTAILDLLKGAAAEFPDVEFRFSEAIHALRSAMALPAQPACELELELQQIRGAATVLEIRSPTPTFGPQPWLALKTTSGTYHFDNLDISTPFHSWRYVFDEETFPVRALDAIGVAANNAFGITTVQVLDPSTGRITTRHWNRPDPRYQTPPA